MVPQPTRISAAGRFAGIEQDGIALGRPAAPATLVEFADLQCPFCAVYATDVLPTVLDRYVRKGKLRLELNLLTFLGGDSVRGGKLAAAAAAQDRLWDFTDGFYAQQGTENTGYADDAFLREVATRAGLDADAAFAARNGAQGVLDTAQGEADRLGVRRRPRSSCARTTASWCRSSSTSSRRWRS